VSTHGRYTMLSKVADGGMAEIFLAQQLGAGGFKKLVVLKRILPNLVGNEVFRVTLFDEAQIAMRLSHSNIVQVLDVGEGGGNTFLVLELVDGWSASQLLKRARAAKKQLPVGLALFIAQEICRGLSYAHTRTETGKPLHIVHRDISPQNVLISAEGEVKVTDFGIARAAVRADRTQAGMVKGKPSYMSPEQAKGQALDARSDVFSVGTVLYVLLTDVLPFKAANELESMLRVQQAKYTPVTKLAPELPRNVARLVSKALKLDKEDRFQSAEEMLVAIEKAQRSSEQPAGQTELKQWLAALAQVDGEKPPSQKARPPPLPDEWIELSDVMSSMDMERITQLEKAEEPPPATPKGPPGWLVLVLLGCLAAGSTVVWNARLDAERALASAVPDAGEWLPFPPAAKDAGSDGATVAAVADAGVAEASDAATGAAPTQEPQGSADSASDSGR
jgi:serine/threonine protein kinase